MASIFKPKTVKKKSNSKLELHYLSLNILCIYLFQHVLSFENSSALQEKYEVCELNKEIKAV